MYLRKFELCLTSVHIWLFQDRGKVRFQRGDACSLPLDIGQFDCVLAANVICQLHTPHAFLDRLPSLVVTGGILVITTPYTFLTQYTPRVSTFIMNVAMVATTGGSGGSGPPKFGRTFNFLRSFLMNRV